ncbi:hypothetical protein [Streptosporangium sp. NPDC051022]|uniref:hypothetical protein n=1 Tax=Streptosporangium sp. NPDC051022 TaxID=3155752 RepID=UPI003430D7BD
MRAKVTAIALAATLTVGGLATGAAAYAALGGAQAPYARAAAVVNADGTVVRSKGVTEVRRLGVGRYCLKLDSDIDATKAVPVATKRWGAPWNSSVFVDADASACGAAAHHVFVGAGNNGAGADVAFHVIVP